VVSDETIIDFYKFLGPSVDLHLHGLQRPIVAYTWMTKGFHMKESHIFVYEKMAENCISEVNCFKLFQTFGCGYCGYLSIVLVKVENSVGFRSFFESSWKVCQSMERTERDYECIMRRVYFPSSLASSQDNIAFILTAIRVLFLCQSFFYFHIYKKPGSAPFCEKFCLT